MHGLSAKFPLMMTYTSLYSFGFNIGFDTALTFVYLESVVTLKL
jgi:hypothetical protein